MKERKMQEYYFVTKASVCKQCKNKFKYESKVYKDNGKSINKRTVCSECQKRSAVIKAREKREQKKKGGK